MPIFIPDRIKTPGDFPSLDANDNQIRGFGFFDSAAVRNLLPAAFRCEGYLAFMKDTDQFKQYNVSATGDASWQDDSNWVLLEGQQTDTYWAADTDGTGIYYNNQVIVSASTYDGSEKFYVNGDARVNGSLKADTKVETPLIHTASGLDVVINTDETATASDDFVVKYRVVGSGGTERNAVDVSPYATTPSVAFGNISDEFKLDHYSPSFSEFRTASADPNSTGFKFTDAFGGDGVMLFRMKTDDSYLELSDGVRKITVVPQEYKIFSDVEADVNVTNGAEILLPDTATGDTHFKNIGNKNFLFSTNAGSGSPTEILEMKPDLVVSNVRLAVGLTSAAYGNLEVTSRALVDIGTNPLPHWAYNIRNSSDAVVGVLGLGLAGNNILVGGFNNGSVSIATHVSDGTLDTEVVAHFNTTGVGIGTTSPSQKLHVVGSMYLLDNVSNNNALIGTGWTDFNGSFNTSLGGGSLSEAGTVSFSTAIGYEAGKNSGSNSVSIGYRANGVTNDVVIGNESGALSTGTENVLIGRRTGQRLQSNNVMIGHEAGRFTTGSSNTAIGYQAFLGVDGETTRSNITAIGRQALMSLTIGSANTAVGDQALKSLQESAGNVAVGNNAGESITNAANVVVGFAAGQNATFASGGYNALVGYQAGQSITGQQNVCVGGLSGLEAESNNVILGLRAGSKVGSQNIVIGMDAGQGGAVAGEVDNSIAIGYEAARYTTGSNSTVIGYQAYKGVSGVSDRPNITAIGYQALFSLTTGASNTAVGHQALQNTTTKSSNTAVGCLALQNMDESGANGQYVTAVGFEAGQNLEAQQSALVGFRAGKNAKGATTAVGYLAGVNVSNGTYFGYGTASGSTVSAIAIGQENYRNVVSGGNEIAIGNQVMWNNVANKATSGNLMIGGGASYYAGIDTSNTVIGHAALRGHNQGTDAGYLNRNYNVTVGYASMYRAYSGANNNVVVGYQAAYSQQIAEDLGDLSTLTYANNVLIGYRTSYDITSGSRNVIIGEQSAFELTEGENNVILGYKAGLNLTTGDANVLLGYGAGGQLTTESNRLYIANVNNTTPLIYGDFDLGRVGVGYGEDDRNAFGHAFCVSPDMIVGKRGFANPDPVAGKLWVVSSNSTQGEMGFSSQYNILAAGFRSYPEDSDNYARDLRMYTKSNSANANEGVERLRITGAGNVGIGETSPDTKLHVTGSQVNFKLLTLENIADANWGGGLILKWANADGSNPYSVDIGAYNISGKQMRFKFTGLSERVSFSGAPGYQFDKEVVPGSGAGDGGIASAYHQHLYFRLRSNNGNNGHDPTNMYFKAEGGTGTTNISGNLMIMKGDGDIEVPNGDLEISDSSNGLILKDTVTSTRYRVQITSGAIAISAV